MPIPISLQLWSLREQLQGSSPAALLQRIASLGYLGVECGGDLYGMSPRDFRTLVEGLGLVISGYHQPLPPPAEAAAFADRAHALGIDHVTFAATPPEQWNSLPELARLADEIEASRAALARRGVKLVYHNHFVEVRPLAGRMGLAHLLERVPELLMEIDVYWAADFGRQDPAAVVRQFRSRTPLLHIKDGPLVQGVPQVAVGSGKMDIEAVIAAADPAVTRWLVVELDECATDMWQAVAESYRYLVGRNLAAGSRLSTTARA